MGGDAPAPGRPPAAGPPLDRGEEHRLDRRVRGPRASRSAPASAFRLRWCSRGSASVRLVCAFLRSVHELFWALLLLQVTGLSPTTGILAIALPYAGIFAKVFSEMIEEADLAAVRVLPVRHGALSAFVYARLPELAVPFKTYTLYRLECGLRSTLVLGFIGLPTMGFHLESAFRQGRYAEAAGLLLAFYVLIGTRRLWARPSTTKSQSG